MGTNYTGKIGFLRKNAIRHLTELDEDSGIDPRDYSILVNDELADEMCMAGIIHDDDMAGVFVSLPEGIVDGTILAETRTGWPPTL